MNTTLEALEEQAVEAALASNWEKAIEINEKILLKDKENVPALLRLGFAATQKKDYTKAKEAYLAVKKIQPSNPIAQESLDKIEVLASSNNHAEAKVVDPNLFIEIPGKTKVISLVNLGQKDVLAKLFVGQGVVFKERKHRLEVRSESDEYIGALPDDVSKRLTYMMQSGSEYSAFVKEASLTRVHVFIREDKKGKKVASFLSFPVDMQSNLHKLQEQSTSENEVTGHHPEALENEEVETEDTDEDVITKLEFEQLAENLEALEEQAKDMALAGQEDESDEEEE